VKLNKCLSYMLALLIYSLIFTIEKYIQTYKIEYYLGYLRPQWMINQIKKPESFRCLLLIMHFMLLRLPHSRLFPGVLE